MKSKTDNILMNNQQKFHIKQHYHELSFFAYDINKVEKIKPEMVKIYVPECSEYYGEHVCKRKNKPFVCCNCEKPHFQEIYLDGWTVGNKYGFLDENSYYAELQTGIRVPVNREIYLAWKNGWTDGWSSSETYEL